MLFVAARSVLPATDSGNTGGGTRFSFSRHTTGRTPTYNIVLVFNRDGDAYNHLCDLF